MSVAPVIEPALTADAVGTTVIGYTPAQIKGAYGLTGLTFNSGKTTADGTGQTIAIVDAYNDPNIKADLATFSTKFGMAAASLTVVSQTGSTSALPATNVSWAQEISLDVERAHAIAPAAKILLVEAKSSSTTDLLSAVGYARTVTGVSAVSMSWGTSEFSSETGSDSYFTAPTGHTSITFVASAGDDGSAAGAEWPAAAAGVLSVGGTSLTATSAGAYTSETGWADGGGGTSKYEGVASFQTVAQSTGFRTTPDVAYDANPSTGVAVYDSLASGGNSGWMEFGGTSAGAPQWAALIAIADQGRATLGYAPLDGATNTLPTLYSLYSTAYATDFHDITSGSTSSTISAKTGYDEVSGIGTPKAAALIASLVKSTLTTKLSQAKVTIGRNGTTTSSASAKLAFVVAVPPEFDDTAVASLARPAVSGTGGFDLAPNAETATLVAPEVSATVSIPYALTTSAIDHTGGFVGIAAQAITPDTGWQLTTLEADVAAPPLSSFSLNLMAGLPAAGLIATPSGPSFAALLSESTRALHPLATAIVAGAATAVWLSTAAARERRSIEAETNGNPFADRPSWQGLARG